MIGIQKFVRQKRPAETVATNATNREEDNFSEGFRAGAQDELAQHVPVVDLDPPLPHLDQDGALDEAWVVAEGVEVGGDHTLLGSLRLRLRARWRGH